MSLYPSLEDMKVGQILQSEQNNQKPTTTNPSAPFIYPGTNPSSSYYNQSVNDDVLFETPSNNQVGALYPSMNSWINLGIDLSSDELQIIQNQQKQLEKLALAQTKSNEVASFGSNKHMIAPLSGNSVGLKRAQVTNGVREVVLCKGTDHKIGMRCKAISNGIFIVLVTTGSPAALAGLRFGDQILQVNEQYVAGMTHEKLHSLIKKLPGDRITIAVRDRPLERTVTLHKDNGGEAGFIFNNGKITSIVKDSSAARNGLLTDHHILEVNGQNVVGLGDKKIRDYIKNSENTLTLTVMPSILFDKMMEKMASSIVKKLMDHTIFDY